MKRLKLEELDLTNEESTRKSLRLMRPSEAGHGEKIAAEVVKLRYFGGLLLRQRRPPLGISIRTANRHWAYPRPGVTKQLSQEDWIGG